MTSKAQGQSGVHIDVENASNRRLSPPSWRDVLPLVASPTTSKTDGWRQYIRGARFRFKRYPIWRGWISKLSRRIVSTIIIICLAWDWKCLCQISRCPCNHVAQCLWQAVVLVYHVRFVSILIGRIRVSCQGQEYITGISWFSILPVRSFTYVFVPGIKDTRMCVEDWGSRSGNNWALWTG
jgi:hypothetical protein